ncbi:hypothetical protein VIGAN_11108100, partial [Vigna angularis var. angularis]
SLSPSEEKIQREPKVLYRRKIRDQFRRKDKVSPSLLLLRCAALEPYGNFLSLTSGSIAAMVWYNNRGATHGDFNGGSYGGSRDRFLEIGKTSPWFGRWVSDSWCLFLALVFCKWRVVSQWFCVSPSLHCGSGSNASLLAISGGSHSRQ